MERKSGDELPQSKTVPVEPGNRIELPAEWAEALGLQGQVALDKTEEGVLVRACPRLTWDDIFATRPSVRPDDPVAVPEISELRGDDLLF